MKHDTRSKLLNQAEKQFSEKGFYGTSIKDIADAVGISKQGLLHHFPSKEKLYAAVLQQATDTINKYIDQSIDLATSSESQLVSVFERLLNAQDEIYQVIVLLIRELLDNPERAKQAKQWYLRPFLDKLTDLAFEAKKHHKQDLDQIECLALIYQLLGATQYFLISKPTLLKMYSAETLEELKRQQLTLIKLNCAHL